jgi:hypothetical protein
MTRKTENIFHIPVSHLYDPISTKQVDKVGCMCGPATIGGISKRIAVQASLSIKARPYPKSY